jgi:hypothetical protein
MTFLFGRDLASEKALLDILDLLAHLFDQHFQLNGGVRHFCIDRFRRQRIRLAVELLHHKVEAATDRLFLQDISRLFHMRFQTIQLFDASIRCAISTSSCSGGCFPVALPHLPVWQPDARAATAKFPAYGSCFSHFVGDRIERCSIALSAPGLQFHGQR